MKKIFISFIAALSIFGASSCSDMLETESSRQLFDPDINQKTDSLFYAFGIMQALQQVADQYVLHGEARGDLVALTKNTDSNIRELAGYQATTANKYDSAYVYYRVINNCNYYIAHRDTTLSTGGQNVVRAEYAAIKAIRAWAYLQLVRTYKSVPFFTEPLVSISQIDNEYPNVDINGLVAALAPDLMQYSGVGVPDAIGDHNAGTTNSGSTKYVETPKCYIPVDVILGDLFIESGDYESAAKYYTNYLITNKVVAKNYYASYQARAKFHGGFPNMPTDFKGALGGFMYDQVWNSSYNDLVTYIPMSVNKRNGTITEVPGILGYDYYATSRSEFYQEDIQLMPSKKLFALADSCDYYYYSSKATSLEELKGSTRNGDQRIYTYLGKGKVGSDTTLVWNDKYQEGNIVLYRTTGIFLRLAECFNRMGYPDAAFAILKEGINEILLLDIPVTEENKDYLYITPETREMLTTTYPFLSDANIATYTSETNYGIHSYGCGTTGDRTYPGSSPYQYKTVVGKKMADIAKTMGVEVGTTKQDTINAVEDLICDEYALELAFDGNRFGDLVRLAKAKNRDTVYGAGFGTKWLMNKLSAKEGVERLADENNWYLPFK